MTYSAQQFIQSPAFMSIAMEDALKLVASKNGQTYELACKAFAQEAPSVVAQVAGLVAKAAQHCADDANAGRLWA